MPIGNNTMKQRSLFRRLGGWHTRADDKKGSFRVFLLEHFQYICGFRHWTMPDYGPALCVLGLIDAALGRKDLALDEGRRAIALMPVEKDVINGSRVLQYFAITAAWAGEKELALQQLEAGLRAPNASQMLSYGALKLFPVWDPLRGDPRFEKIVQSLAPKD